MSRKPSSQQNDRTLAESLVQLSYLIQSILSRVGAEHDLSIPQIRLLGILRDREPGMLQLARYLGLDKSSMTGLVDRAERRGLVERIATPGDRRGFNVRLTESGRQLAQIGEKEIHRQIHDAIEGLTDTERSQLIAIAGKMLDPAESTED